MYKSSAPNFSQIYPQLTEAGVSHKELQNLYNAGIKKETHLALLLLHVELKRTFRSKFLMDLIMVSSFYLNFSSYNHTSLSLDEHIKLINMTLTAHMMLFCDIKESQHENKDRQLIRQYCFENFILHSIPQQDQNNNLQPFCPTLD